MDTLVRVSPVEIIANEEAKEKFSNMPLIKHGVIPKIDTFTESQFSLTNATTSLKNQFKVQNFTAFDFEGNNQCICASGALVAYVFETQKHALLNINKIKREKVVYLKNINHLLRFCRIAPPENGIEWLCGAKYYSCWLSPWRWWRRCVRRVIMPVMPAT